MNNTKLSKFLSYVLRHNPDAIGLQLDEFGWADIDELIALAEKDGKQFTKEQLMTVVANSDKQRFKVSEDGKQIRANQGHSLPVDLGLNPSVPPPLLYHGTAQKNLKSIQAQGLKPRARHHVHLSADITTAIKVGQRHGKPVVLEIDTQKMSEAGCVFYQSDNGVWLTDDVPPQYLQVRLKR